MQKLREDKHDAINGVTAHVGMDQNQEVKFSETKTPIHAFVARRLAKIKDLMRKML